MSLESWKAFFEIGGVALLAATFVFGAGAFFVNSRINVIASKELADFKLKFEGEQQKTAQAQKEAAEAKALAGGLERDVAKAKEGVAEANERTANAQIELQREEQKTSAAIFNEEQAEHDLWSVSISNQSSTKKNELATRQLGDMVFERERHFDGAAFVSVLKDKPKAHVEILYKREDAEAWELASQIVHFLGEGDRQLKGAGWEVSGPIALPIESADGPPAEVMFGAGSGLGVISQYQLHPGNTDTPLDALVTALEASLSRLSRAGFMTTTIPDMPPNLIRIVVGQMH
jgi:hypothetical protein